MMWFQEKSCCLQTYILAKWQRSLWRSPKKKALSEILDVYSSDTVVNKLTPCANSQRNESLNSTIGSKNPNTRFYEGSESNDFRVACGVAQPILEQLHWKNIRDS